MTLDIISSFNQMPMLHTIYFGLKEYSKNRLII